MGPKQLVILTRRREKKAIVAVGRSILIITWHLLSDPDARYRDLGSHYYDAHQSSATRRQHVRQLEALGYKVTLEPAA